MADLSTVASMLEAWYRMVGSVPSDYALTELGEAQDEIGYIYLTSGCHEAQNVMLDAGYRGWRKRTAALTWTGTDATTGGVSYSLPSDFLRADGSRRRSCLVEADGDPWGTQLEPETGMLYKGDGFYFDGDDLWLSRTASPPSTLYLNYHYHHPEWTSAVTIDFPLRARMLIVVEAANEAKNENWFTGGPEEKQAIREAVLLWERKARKLVRSSKDSRHWQRQKVYGRW